MKDIIITETLPQGARFAQLSQNFKMQISIENDILFIDFFDEKSEELLFGTYEFVDWEEDYKSFDDFTEKGQDLILERLREAIVTDVCAFVSGNYENLADPGIPYHSINGCMDMDAYKQIWASYYALICDDEDILDEYESPEVDENEDKDDEDE